jgi:two-component system, cell cycle sensor histidine kinase and response regulator CckA
MKNAMIRLVSMSIRSQLLLLALIVAVPAAGIIVYSGLQTREAAINDAHIETQRLAANIAAEQQNLITSAQQLMIALSQLPEVKKQDRDQVEPVLRDILRLNTQYSNIFIADRDGLVWATAVPTRPPFIVSDRQYFKNALTRGQLSSGEYVIGRATTKPVFNIGYPLKNERGTIIGVIGLGFVLDELKILLERAKLPAGANFVLLDHKGTVLYRAVGDADYIGEPYDSGLFKLMQDGPDENTLIGNTGVTGVRRIFTYRKLRLPGEKEPYMYIRAGIPVAAVLSDANNVLLRNLSIFISGLFLAILFAWLIGKRSIADRIMLLEKASQSLAEGNLNIRVSDLVSGGELGRLGQTFDSMAQQLLLREQARVQSDRNYQDIFNTTKDAIFVHDAELGQILEVNHAVEELYGYSREEILNHQRQHLTFVASPYSLKEALEWIRKAFKEGSQHFEWLAKKKNGELFWTEVVLSATRIGGAGRVLAVVRDITERKRMELALQRSERRLKLAAASGHLGIWDRDIETGNLIWDDRMYEIYGVTRDSFLPTFGTWATCLHSDDRERITQESMAAVRGEKDYDTEFRILHPDGSVKYIKANGVVIRDADGKATQMIGINRDITEQKNLEEKLRQSQKIEVVGQLAGGVAHDFNNILTAIIGYGNLINLKLSATDPLQHYVAQILSSSEKAAELTRSLLAFSRKQVLNPVPIDINKIVTDMQKILERVIGENIEFKVITTDHGLIVKSDKSQIEQVLLNLATNARDAMPHGGALSITTSEVEIDEQFIRAQQYGHIGRYAVITVTDTGIGMDKTTQERIFEPFFTTKEVGKGTGLGLAMAYGTIKQHDGFINVYSESGIGTTFRIYLPLTDASVEHAEEKTTTALSMGTETLLLIEDDDIVRTVTKTMIEGLGYDVIEASDGQQAVALFR